MKIAAVQMTPTTDPAENFRKMREFAAEAAEDGAHVIVFPEQAMVLLQSVTVAALSEIATDWWDEFARLTAELAVTHGAVVVNAGFEPAGEGLPFNTMLVCGPDGSELARYRKLHLYEAFSASESDHTQPGHDLPPVFDVEHEGERLRFGLANCYDVRFPEMFRSLVDKGANAFIVSAAWATGPGKEEHWTLLTQARALENVSWMVACGAVGGGSRGLATSGLSRVIEPLGTVVAALGARGEGVLIAEVSAAAVDRARATLPALANRKIALQYVT